MPNNNRLSERDPSPLYHQIASEIRRRIQEGTLRPGDVLTPLREAAREWGVHLHTVRHAYAALAREGLVETRRGPHGTRVAAGADSTRSRPDAGGAPDTLEFYLRGVVAEVRRRWSLDADGLIDAIRRHSPFDTRPVAFVVECSAHQCELHAAELRARFDVDAHPWPLTLPDAPPPGEVVATYFHYNDIRRRWPHLLERVRFVTITPDPISLRVSGEAVAVCERDRETAEAVAADVSRVLASREREVIPCIVERPEDALALEYSTLLFSPRVWAELPDAVRSNPRVGEIRYIFDPDELSALGERLGWQPHMSSQEV
jgi:DNA-binding transcriptional regulator YhcF (GntR family)